MTGTSHYLGDHTALTRTAYGRLIYVDTRDIHLTPHLLTLGMWEPNTTELFVDRIGKAQLGGHRPLVIDVGANVGWFTLLAFRCGEVDVVSVEPNPRHVELLYKTLSVNGYSSERLRRLAVTSRELAGGLPLRFGWIPEEGGGATVEASPTAPHVERFTATGTTLDALVGTHAADYDQRLVIKIDVEGHEPYVLDGAEETLERRFPPVLFIEHNLADRRRAENMYEGLFRRGYQLRHVQASGHPSAPLDLAAIFALRTAEMLLCEVP